MNREGWNFGPPWRDLHRRAWWSCGLGEEGAIEPRAAKPGLGQGIMQKWGLVFLISVQDSFSRTLSPVLHYSNTPVILADESLVIIS